MEHWGDNQNYATSAIHTPSSYGNTINKGGRTVSNVSNEFHLYAIEWSPEKIIFKVDDIIHYTYNPSIKDDNTWPFDEPQYILLNVAILPNTISTSFTESDMVIDYIRVYNESSLSNLTFDENTKFSIYPNPVIDNLNVSFNSEVSISKLQVYTINGSLLIEKEISEKTRQLVYNFSDLKSGFYFVKMALDNGQQVIRNFIKQ